MRFLIFLFVWLDFLFAWCGVRIDKYSDEKHYINIPKGNLVRTGLKINIVDFQTHTLKEVEVIKFDKNNGEVWLSLKFPNNEIYEFKMGCDLNKIEKAKSDEIMRDFTPIDEKISNKINKARKENTSYLNVLDLDKNSCYSLETCYEIASNFTFASMVAPTETKARGINDNSGEYIKKKCEFLYKTSNYISKNCKNDYKKCINNYYMLKIWSFGNYARFTDCKNIDDFIKQAKNDAIFGCKSGDFDACDIKLMLEYPSGVLGDDNIVVEFDPLNAPIYFISKDEK